MLASTLAICLLALPAGPPRTAAFERAAMSADDQATLHKQLMDKVEAMDRSSQGIFNDDVTPLVARYFPAGQSYADTAAILRDQELGELKPYVGKTGPGDGTMYVSRFDLMSHVFAHVFVVLHFAYRRAPDGSLGLDHMRAYLRSQTM